MSEWLARFARALRRPQTWLNLLYLLAAFPLGLAYFVVLVVGLSVGAALAVVIGLAILLATLAATRAMAAIERAFEPCSACPSHSRSTAATCAGCSGSAAGCATR